MLTSVYNGAFTRALNRAAQGSGFEGCFAREQDGNKPELSERLAPTVIDLVRQVGSIS